METRRISHDHGQSPRISPVLQFSKPVCSGVSGKLSDYPHPPQSTGLLSLVGEETDTAYIGTRLAVAVVKRPAVSMALVTAWRVKDKKTLPGTGSNRRPDYQEVLSGLVIGVWVAVGHLEPGCGLARRSELTTRFGGLCLGERDLVDEVAFDPVWGMAMSAVVDPWIGEAPHPLPVWVDHVGSKGDRWGQFRVLEEAYFQQPQALMIHGGCTIYPPDGRRSK